MSPRIRHFSIITALTAVSTFGVYLLINLFLFERPFGVSNEAVLIERMFQAHFWLIGFLFSIIVVPLLYAVIVFRQKPGDDSDAPHIHGNTTLEIAWTILPVILVIGFAVWGVALYTDIVSAEANERTIRAHGFKWDWTFYYPELSDEEQVRADPTLVLEVDQPVVIEMQSSDVIHAFWVPQFRVKQDVLPFNTALRETVGDRDIIQLSFSNPNYQEAAAEHNYRPQEIRFTPTETGVYRLRCAEICGTQHWAMLANAIVLESADYQAWVNGELVLPADPNFTNGTAGIEGYYLDELSDFCEANGFSGVNCETDY